MLALLTAFLGGVTLVLIVEIFIVYRWFRAQPNEDPKLITKQKPVSNPKIIADFCRIEEATESESCMFLNLIFQFLWKEWRDSPKTRNFFICKMNTEFKEMLLNKAAGKLIEQISVCDYYLGDSLPIFKNATVMKVDTSNPSQVPKEIDIAVDIEYSGGFIISLDVGLIFGKSAHFTVELDSLQGRLRLQLTRNPCTHWSFSFYEDPVMELKVESNFEGKNLPKLTTFISNQIRRSIKKKHTLPNYKVRYKPFFIQEKPQDGKNEIFYHNSLITVGKLDVEIVECTRLPPLPKGSHIYCTLSLDSLPWKEDMPLRRSLWPVHEVLICRAPSGVIGISFFQEIETVDDEKLESVLIKTVSPNSPASHVDVQIGDILISVNNVDIVTMKQAVRLIKNAGNKFTLKLQRPPIKKQPDPMVNQIKVQNPDDNGSVRAKFGEFFDFNSILLHDEDSETEEFVNIVVHEIEREMLGDEATKKFINEVKLLRRISSEKKEYFNGENKVDPLRDKTSVAKNSEKNTSASTSGSSERQSLGKKKRRLTFPNSLRKKTLKLDPVIESDNFETSEHSSASIESVALNKKEVDEVSASNSVPVLDKFCEAGINKLETGSLCTKDWDDITQQVTNVNIDSEITQVEEDKEPTGQRTSIASANQEPVWNEIFTFDVEREHKFLNICVWGKCEDTFEKDLLLGYVSIPLMDLSLECLSTNSRKSIQTFLLAVTESRSAISRAYLRVMMPGLSLNQCNGDITLAYKYVSAIPEDDLLNEETKLVEEQNKKMGYPFSKVDDKDSTDIIPKEHNFIGTDFYFPTRCEYCQRKVWRKVAFQCRVCAMVCHKRCLQKAQNYTYCTSNGVRAKPPVWQKIDPPVAGEVQDGPPIDQSSSNVTVNSSPSKFPHPLSKDSWSIPEEYDLHPGHNVLRRRKGPSNNEDAISCQDTSVPRDSEAIYQDIDQNLDDSISRAKVTAKEAGRELCASLDEKDRELFLQKKLEEFQEVIMAERYNQENLKETLNSTANSKTKENAVEKLRKSEDRVQGLSLLMIQYGAALNECFVQSQPQQCDL